MHKEKEGEAEKGKKRRKESEEHEGKKEKVRRTKREKEKRKKRMKKPYFPMFVDLSGRQVTVVGGGSVALRRSETLLYFGVDIKVIAPEIRSEFYRLDSEGKVVLCNREYQEGDAKGADLVIAASNCREVNRRVYEECQKAHIPVNTADDRELCDFYFPSVVLAEDIVIGLNSIDHDPKKVKEARKIIENVFDNERDYRS